MGLVGLTVEEGYVTLVKTFIRENPMKKRGGWRLKGLIQEPARKCCAFVTGKGA